MRQGGRYERDKNGKAKRVAHTEPMSDETKKARREAAKPTPPPTPPAEPAKKGA